MYDIMSLYKLRTRKKSRMVGPSYEAWLIKYFNRYMHRLRAILSIRKKKFPGS